MLQSDDNGFRLLHFANMNFIDRLTDVIDDDRNVTSSSDERISLHSLLGLDSSNGNLTPSGIRNLHLDKVQYNQFLPERQANVLTRTSIILWKHFIHI